MQIARTNFSGVFELCSQNSFAVVTIHCGMASSSFLDSEATFVQQAEDGGLSRDWVDALKAIQMATFAKLSFAITTPGTVATDDQINRFLNTIRVGVAPTIAELAAFKRLVFESQTLMMHSFKTTARGEEAGPKKMAQPERDARPLGKPAPGTRPR